MITQEQLESKIVTSDPQEPDQPSGEHQYYVSMVEKWCEGSPFGHKETKPFGRYSIVCTKQCPNRPDEPDGGFGLVVTHKGRVRPTCFHNKCQSLTITDVENQFGSPCPLTQFPAEVIARHTAEQLGSSYVYSADTDETLLYVNGRFVSLKTNAVKTELLPHVKYIADELGFKLGRDGWSAILQELQGMRKAYTANRPPQWWNGTPVIDSPSWEDANNVMVVGNGLLNPLAYARGEQHFYQDRTPRLFHRFASEVNYDPSAMKMPNWERFLRDIEFDSDEVCLLQESLPIASFPTPGEQYVILTQGAGGAGKGVAMGVCVGVVGTYALSRQIDQVLRGFGQGDLQGKTLFAVAEAEADRKQLKKFVALLKRISGRDRDSVDVKNSAFTELTHLPTPFVQANELLPHIQDAQGAMKRRIIPIHFHRQFAETEQDKELPKKLEAEYSAILNWMLEGYKRFYERGHFVLPESSQHLLSSFADSSSPLQAFIDDCLEPCKDSCVGTLALYDLYVRWFRTSGETDTQLSQRQFNAQLPTTMPGVLPSKRMRNPTGQQLLPGERPTSQVRVFRGLRVTIPALQDYAVPISVGAA